MSLLELFCEVDDFWLDFEPQWKASHLAAGKQRERGGQLCPSEVMTILLHFHQSHYRTFKAYYTEHVQVHLRKEFPHLVSYPRFVALIPQMMLPLLAYLQTRYGACTGISFIDSTSDGASVILNGSISTASLRLMPSVARAVWAGSLGSSSTWRSMTKANCWRVV